MEGVSANVCKGIKSYWKRRGYQRINGVSGRRRKSRQVELGQAGSNQKRRFWRFKITPRLKLRISPKKFFIRLRDAYVRMMLRIANTSVVHSGSIGGVYGGDGINQFGLRRVKEYDEKMIIEIYKSLAVAQGLVPRDPAKITAQIPCARFEKTFDENVEVLRIEAKIQNSGLAHAHVLVPDEFSASFHYKTTNFQPNIYFSSRNILLIIQD